MYTVLLFAEKEKEVAILTTDVEQKMEEATSAGAQAAMSGDRDAVKPVVFGGKVYNIPTHQTAKDVFGKASAVTNARRQMKLKFDKSPVVVKPRTLALVKATGRAFSVHHCQCIVAAQYC